jgi:hypothetical protein
MRFITWRDLRIRVKIHLGCADYSELNQAAWQGSESQLKGIQAMGILMRFFGYLRSSGAHLAAGHTSQVGENEFVRFRQPTKDEAFLEAEGELLVVEIVGAG